jgi:hypothetical protein
LIKNNPENRLPHSALGRRGVAGFWRVFVAALQLAVTSVALPLSAIIPMPGTMRVNARPTLSARALDRCPR